MRLLILLAMVAIIAVVVVPDAASDSYAIIQTPLERLVPDMLDERQPIIVEQPLPDPAQLLDTTFRFRYVLAKMTSLPPGGVKDINSRFALVFLDANAVEPALIHVLHPSQRATIPRRVRTWSQVNAPYVSLRLKPAQVVIVPHGWVVGSEPKNTSRFGAILIHDVRSLVRSALLLG